MKTPVNRRCGNFKKYKFVSAIIVSTDESDVVPELEGNASGPVIDIAETESGVSRTSATKHARGAMKVSCEIDLNETLFLRAKLEMQKQHAEVVKRRLEGPPPPTHVMANQVTGPTPILRNAYEQGLLDARQARVARFMTGTYRHFNPIVRGQLVQQPPVQPRPVQPRPLVVRTRAGARMTIAPIPLPPPTTMTGKNQ